LATCEANGLEYVTDGTNFQPDVTLRNAIRHVIEHKGSYDGIADPRLKEQLETIEASLAKSPQLGMSLSAGRGALRQRVLDIARAADAIMVKVGAALSQCTHQSPPGTIFLPDEWLANFPDDSLTRRAFVMSVLRYVSPNPTDTLQMQAGGRGTSSNAIQDILWHGGSKNARVLGSGVIWKYVVLRNGTVKDASQSASRSKGGTYGWLASRQPPARKNEGLQADGHGSAALERDVTPLLAGALSSYQLQQGSGAVDVLWDNRFRIRFKLDQAHLWSGPGTRITLRPYGKWVLPQVTAQTCDGDDAAPRVWKLEPSAHSKLSEEIVRSANGERRPAIEFYFIRSSSHA